MSYASRSSAYLSRIGPINFLLRPEYTVSVSSESTREQAAKGSRRTTSKDAMTAFITLVEIFIECTLNSIMIDVERCSNYYYRHKFEISLG